MTFWAANGLQRPIRLCEKTRQFAKDSLERKYGKQTKATPAVLLDDVAEFTSLSMLERYDLAITRIANEAPIRICDGELISGAATLGLAIDHCVPATYGGTHICNSISHLTVDFETVLKLGASRVYTVFAGTSIISAISLTVISLQ